ncbi:hypothetical protein [Reyranella soli]|jgi:hypothetical protein|uniref:OmpA-like domain-containing protein n=1 Tax=Reyranella soli TaxID=1230389 RepID=A0A512NQB5_9HYPH|nr:hypothetical protein [Reyranella soli]GEP61117.1 hypothetical protein RSO01_82830 [Reyranella soli]
MQKYRIAAVILGGLFLASPAMAQSTNLAYATGEPRSETIIFLQKGNVLPPSAAPMVSNAITAARAGKTVHLQGRTDQAEAVKQEMIRDGAPANAIVVAHEPVKALPKVDSVSDAASRTVAIKY